MKETIFDVLERHPKLRKHLENPYWEMEIDNSHLAATGPEWSITLKTTGGIKLEWYRYDLTLAQVDEVFTELEGIMDRADELARHQNERKR